MMQIFSPSLVAAHRRRAAPRFADHIFLHHDIADRLIERLGDVNRHFTNILELGARDRTLADALTARYAPQRLVLTHSFEEELPRDLCRIVATPEMLPFAASSFDLILSSLALHWINDLPGALLQLRRALKPDGLLLATLFGGETLQELRTVLLAAEIELRGGGTARVSPMADLRDLAGLLQRAGFALPMADADRITVRYPDLVALINDLRGQGETAAFAARGRLPLTRAIFARAAALYAERFPHPTGGIVATFQIMILTGWAPDASQRPALHPGTGQIRLAAALGGDETLFKPE